jgi:hypothetical protein
VVAAANNVNFGVDHKVALANLAIRVSTSDKLTSSILSMEWPKAEGAFLDVKSKVLRVKALDRVLKNGRPLAVLDEFRDLIEGDGTSGTLTDSSHMSNLIPLYGVAMDKALSEKKFYSAALVFDGLSDKGNWVPTLFRGVLKGTFTLAQGLLDMPHTSKPYDHSLLNSIIIKAAFKLERCGDSLEFPLSRLIQFLIHDDAEVNNLASSLLIGALFQRAQSVSCQCHVQYRIGECVCMPEVEKFLSHWLAIFKNADKRREIYRERTHLAFPSFNKIKVLVFLLLFHHSIIYLSCAVAFKVFVAWVLPD